LAFSASVSIAFWNAAPSLASQDAHDTEITLSVSEEVYFWKMSTNPTAVSGDW
jgi:hypothetical protein